MKLKIEETDLRPKIGEVIRQKADGRRVCSDSKGLKERNSCIYLIERGYDG